LTSFIGGQTAVLEVVRYEMVCHTSTTDEYLIT